MFGARVRDDIGDFKEHPFILLITLRPSPKCSFFFLSRSFDFLIVAAMSATGGPRASKVCVFLFVDEQTI